MNQEDKELLLKDLCARLPYRVKCSFGVDDAVYEITGVNPTCCGASEIQATHVKSSVNGDFRLNSCKPYLFSLSSMTEEQYKTYCELEHSGDMEHLSLPLLEWLNKNYFDYRGLIEKGLAINAAGLNIY